MKNRIALLFASLIVFNFLPASAQLANWMKTGAGTGESQGYDVARDTSGNVYTTGRFTGTVSWGSSKTTISSGSDDMFIAKYNAQGVIQWAHSGGSANSDWGYAVATDRTGYVYVAGWFWGAADFGPAYVGNGTLNSSSNDIFLLKYNWLGDLIWAKRFGGSGGDYPSELTIDNSGNICMSGHFNASFTVGSNQLVNGGGYDVFLIKMDSSGIPLWSKRAGGAGDENATFIGVNTSNEVVMGGRFSGTTTFGSTTTTSAGDYDFFVTKFDTSGNISWTKTGGGAGFDNVECVYVDNTDIYVGGRFESPAFTFRGHTFTNNGNADALLIKFDSSGVMNWATSFGGSGFEQALGICVVTNNVYVGGEMQNSVGFPRGKTLVSNGNSDAFYAGFDSSGSFINAISFGGVAYDAIQNMFPGARGGKPEIFVTGEYGANFTLDGNTYTNSGNSDVFTASLDTFGVAVATGVSSILSSVKLNIYPNPGTGDFYLNSNVALTHALVSVTDITGKIIWKEELKESKTIIHLNGQPAGIYFITVTSEEVNSSFRVKLQ